MQIRDMIELLQQHDPYDEIKVEVTFATNLGHEATREGEVETVTRNNGGSPYVVIKCRE